MARTIVDGAQYSLPLGALPPERRAGAHDISKLVGCSISAEFDGNLLGSWRILTEVL